MVFPQSIFLADGFHDTSVFPYGVDLGVYCLRMVWFLEEYILFLADLDQ